MKEYIKKQVQARKILAPILQQTFQSKQPGIYLWERTDERDITFFYCGQAVNMYQRTLSHIMGYQRIDLSIRKRKFKSIENPYGWTFRVLEYCKKEELDSREQYWILEQLKEGKQTYNLNYGGNEGKQTIQEGKTPKGYHDGVQYGYNKFRKEVKRIIDLHLEVIPKNANNKNDLKAMAKFNELIGMEEDG